MFTHLFAIISNNWFIFVFVVKWLTDWFKLNNDKPLYLYLTYEKCKYLIIYLNYAIIAINT